MSIFSCALPFPRYYPISDPTIIRDIRDVNVQLHLFQLLSNFHSHTVVRDICDIRVHLQLSMTSVMSMIQLHPASPRYYAISDFTHHP